ncbi:MAG: acyl-CoA dehydratase activase, partial [Lentisphaeria bacterium]
MGDKISIGIDIGSTTIKMYATAGGEELVKDYRRHYSKINEALLELFKDNHSKLGNRNISITFSGSAGLRYSEDLGFGYLQEVIAASRSVKSYVPQTRTAVELGGEDAKIIYFEDSLDHRMNGVCAGGTGAFIDQMAQLLNVQASDLNELAKSAEHIYPIASRCGVFAKTDVQPLLNQGARKADVAASIFQAVVNQTIGALSRGKPLVAPITFLGGPLTFLPELRNRFALTLGVAGEDAITPEDSQYFVAKGAETESRHSSFTVAYESVVNSIGEMENRVKAQEHVNDPLFVNEEAYGEFVERHKKERAAEGDLDSYEGDAFLGIDAGSTTSKIVLVGRNSEILYSYYGSNQGQTLEIIRKELVKLLERIDGRIRIVGAGSTGYGEQLIQSAFNLDLGEVETVAHYRAASHFSPNVDFIIDIGGQDMKCFKVRNGAIENIILNEACSSGCGSFIETFAGGLGYSVQEFTKLGIKSQDPVELGTRCTVFMNSKVKQAQKEGYSVSDISAGLALSVVKNALFKVIRLKDVEYLGENIVVQGGTFYNDAVLRAFEKVLNKDVVRPNIAGLMGAFGVALLAAEKSHGKSSMLDLNQLREAKYSSKQTRCRACSNACTLTVNKFGNRNIISGNKCEKGDSSMANKEHLPDMMEYKYQRVFDYSQSKDRKFSRGKMGIMRVLNFYENYPFWFTFFDKLDFEVILSSNSTVEMMNAGVSSVVSENICYPAKMAHGHIVELLELKVPNIFYPCLTYNIKESSDSHNHYNCPIVTSYPELIAKNLPKIEETNFI